MNGENAIDSTCSVSNDELTKRFVSSGYDMNLLEEDV